MSEATGAGSLSRNVTRREVMRRRFLITFSVLTVAQVVGVAIFSYTSALGADLIRTIYYPFLFLVEPLVRAMFGDSDGGLGYLFLGALVAGAVTYSAILGLLATRIRRTPR